MHKNIKRTENFNSRKIREQDSQTQMNQFKFTDLEGNLTNPFSN